MATPPKLSEAKLKSFDFAQEALKQVLTLATASLGGAVAILDDGNLPGIQFGPSHGMVMVGLGLLILSIGSGLLALNNLAGTLDKSAEGTATIYKPSIQLFWAGQLLFFVTGLAFLAFALL